MRCVHGNFVLDVAQAISSWHGGPRRVLLNETGSCSSAVSSQSWKQVTAVQPSVLHLLFLGAGWFVLTTALFAWHSDSAAVCANEREFDVQSRCLTCPYLPESTSAMVRILSLQTCLLCVSLLASSTATANTDEFFEKKVRPLLVKRCYACHSGTKHSGGLSLETRSGWQKGGDSGPAIVPRNPESSPLIDAINYRGLKMPPPDKGGRISDAEIAVLTQWVKSGARDPRDDTASIGGMTLKQAQEWWAFQPLPQIEGRVTSTTVDAYLNEARHRAELTQSDPADKRTLIRRATYDLTGLPPIADVVDAFVADDSPDAFDAVIDRLLQSPQYGARWGRHWLDVVRYADTAGENSDRPLPHAWRYRNWVIRSFNDDVSFREFARLQLAGDLLRADAAGKDRRDGIVATGYLAVARRFGHDIDKSIHLMNEDVIDNLGKNFLGLTLGCARCHDHKYDPVTSADYYALYGIFKSTKFSFPGCEPRGQPKDLVPLVSDEEAATISANYEKVLAAYKARTFDSAGTTLQLKQAAAKCVRVLTEGLVEEGQSVALQKDGDDPPDRIAMRKGEVLQLTVLPNGNYGADTTRLEWQITNLENTGERQRWDLRNIIPKLLDTGPSVTDQNATWCFLDVSNGPSFLKNGKPAINGVQGLSAWANGDNPAVFVNKLTTPVSVWTTLPPMSVFCHPGPTQPVAVAWVCPADGEYQVTGSVTDGHPAPGLDGVSFRLEHFPSREIGDGLLQLAQAATKQAEPEPPKPVIPVAYAVMESESTDVPLQERGDPELPGEVIPRRWLNIFGGAIVEPNVGSGRRQLADWVVDNPLFARVMVNRVWHWHFGRGLVATPNDFGSRGQPPSHPELLDRLAARFRDDGYRLKPLHRLIMKTAAYRRSSDAAPSVIQKDPGNRWLARFTRRRLSAEEIRDSLLAASGHLDLTPAEAHPFPPENTWKFTQHAPFSAVYETNRRSVYLMVQRQRRHPYLALFDGADPNSSTDRRETTTVPTQALYFLNDPFFHEHALQTAKAVLEKEYPETEQIARLFRRLYQRLPSSAETDVARQFLATYPGEASQKLAALTRVLLSANEYLYVD